MCRHLTAYPSIRKFLMRAILFGMIPYLVIYLIIIANSRMIEEYLTLNQYITKQHVLCQKSWEDKAVVAKSKLVCDCIPPKLSLPKKHFINLEPVSIENTTAENPKVQSGGRWHPQHCTARYKVAIVIPYRDRKAHLLTLLRHLHPILQQQEADYMILVVEQHLPEVFNKAVMMNVGYKYAVTKHNADCVIFHDVDFIPEDPMHLYRCSSRPVHMGAFYSTNNYIINYTMSFGGVTAFTPTQFEKVNGFSNLYFGWGGEDDDMWLRVREQKLGLIRNPPEIAGYTVITHKRDEGNIQPDRQAMLNRLSKKRQPKKDGLNTLNFVQRDIKDCPLYTWILVDVGLSKP